MNFYIEVSHYISCCALYTGWFISPSGTSELGCATTKADTAERRISEVENLSTFFFLCTRRRGVLAGFTARVQPWRNMAWIGNKKAFCVLEFAKTESIVTVQRRTCRATVRKDRRLECLSFCWHSPLRRDHADYCTAEFRNPGGTYELLCINLYWQTSSIQCQSISCSQYSICTEHEKSSLRQWDIVLHTHARARAHTHTRTRTHAHTRTRAHARAHTHTYIYI
jgi:hypothetical protein